MLATLATNEQGANSQNLKPLWTTVGNLHSCWLGLPCAQLKAPAHSGPWGMRQEREALSTLPASLTVQPPEGQCLSRAVWNVKCCCPCQGDGQHPGVGAERQDPRDGDGGWWEGAPPAAEKDKDPSRLDFIPDMLSVLKRKLWRVPKR